MGDPTRQERWIRALGDLKLNPRLNAALQVIAMSHDLDHPSVEAVEEIVDHLLADELTTYGFDGSEINFDGIWIEGLIDQFNAFRLDQ